MQSKVWMVFNVSSVREDAVCYTRDCTLTALRAGLGSAPWCVEMRGTLFQFVSWTVFLSDDTPFEDNIYHAHRIIICDLWLPEIIKTKAQKNKPSTTRFYNEDKGDIWKCGSLWHFGPNQVQNKIPHLEQTEHWRVDF